MKSVLIDVNEIQIGFKVVDSTEYSMNCCCIASVREYKERRREYGGSISLQILGIAHT